MGQKLNPIIFRLGVNKIWKTEFFEKKNHELALYIFKDLEIRNYIERLFETNGIIVHDYKQHYSASTLNLYISYFVTSECVLGDNNSSERFLIGTTAGTRHVINKKMKKKTFYKVSSNQIIGNLLRENSSRCYIMKQYLKLNPCSQILMQTSSAIFDEAKKNKHYNYSSKNIKTYLEGFLVQIFEVLNLFLGSHLNLVVNFCCINKNVQFYKSTQKKTFISFQKFKNAPFFKEGIELLFNVVFNANSANLLAKFIGFQLKKVKRHKFLLSFLKQILGILLVSSLARVKGVKIILKGRLNGVPRAKHKIIIIGNVTVQTISAKLDYSQVAVCNPNGTYGIKVWVVEK